MRILGSTLLLTTLFILGSPKASFANMATPSTSPSSSCSQTTCSITTSCTCSYSTGTSSQSSSANSCDCQDTCTKSGAKTWNFFCGEGVTPTASGTIISEEVTAKETKKDLIFPELNTPIPGLVFDETSLVRDNNNRVISNVIGVYVNAVYRYALVIAAILGVLMLSISGFQYMTAGGNKGAVAKAKGRMEQTVFGLVILMAIYAIAFFIDPRLTRFLPISLEEVQDIPLENVVEPDDGVTPSSPTGNFYGQNSWQDCMLTTFGKDASSVSNQLVTLSINGQQVQVHSIIAQDVKDAFAEIEAAGLSSYVTSIGAYNWRANRNNPKALSFHSWGVAIDINDLENPNCKQASCSYTMPQGIINAFKNHNFGWGGDWKAGNKDYMHFSTKRFCGGSR